MPIRKVQFAPGEHYHLCDRGVGKQQIFYEKRDYIRFLLLLLHLQAPIAIRNAGRAVTYFEKHKTFHPKGVVEIIQRRDVVLETFVAMPNHFHLSLEEKKEGGISRYMQRVLNAYAKYFNTKNKRVGHVFEGPFRAVHVETNEQLLYLSAYIHRNPRELTGWKGKELKYPWSSYQDLVSKNRWGELLKPQIILAQFSNSESYRKFVEESGAKESIVKKIGDELLLE